MNNTFCAFQQIGLQKIFHILRCKSTYLLGRVPIHISLNSERSSISVTLNSFLSALKLSTVNTGETSALSSRTPHIITKLHLALIGAVVKALKQHLVHTYYTHSIALLLFILGLFAYQPIRGKF